MNKPVLVSVGILILLVVGVYLYVQNSTPDDPNSPVYKDDTKIVETVTGPRPEVSFEINGVPYTGFHNHTERWSRFQGDLDSAFGSLIYYWRPRTDNVLSVVENFFREIVRVDNNNLTSDFDIIDAILSRSYGEEYVHQVKKMSVEEIGDYVNESVSTPLITFMTVTDESYPDGIDSFPVYVIYGINYEKQTLIMHSFWEGPDYVMSFDEFTNRQSNLPEHLKDTFVIFQPRTFKGSLSVVSQYPRNNFERGDVMESSLEMVRWYPIANEALVKRNFPVAREYFEKIVEHPDFEESLPPFLKVMVLYRLGDLYSKEFDDNEKAITLIEQAVAYNQNLDQPFKDWPGYEVRRDDYTVTDTVASVHRVLGDAYIVAERYEDAQEQYRIALQIDRDDPKALDGMTALESDTPLETLMELRINRVTTLENQQ